MGLRDPDHYPLELIYQVRTCRGQPICTKFELPIVSSIPKTYVLCHVSRRFFLTKKKQRSSSRLLTVLYLITDRSIYHKQTAGSVHVQEQLSSISLIVGLPAPEEYPTPLLFGKRLCRFDYCKSLSHCTHTWSDNACLRPGRPVSDNIYIITSSISLFFN